MNKKQQTSRISRQQQCHIFKLVYKRVVRSSHIHTLTHHFRSVCFSLTHSFHCGRSFGSFARSPARLRWPVQATLPSCRLSIATAGTYAYSGMQEMCDRQRVLPLMYARQLSYLYASARVRVLERDDLVIISYVSLYIFLI